MPLSKALRHRELGMSNIKERYLVDEDGNCIGVMLDIVDYRRLLQELEEKVKQIRSLRKY